MADTLTLTVGSELLEISANAAYVLLTDESGEIVFSLDVGAGSASRYIRVVVIGPADIPVTDPTTWV
jgi:hypothetical protein